MNRAERPPISVVMPFAGSRAERTSAIARLRRIQVGSDDELILVVNGEQGINDFLEPQGERLRVVWATEELSSYFARNSGAEVAVNEWLLFVDADCVPPQGLLADYFRPPPTERCGVVAGGVAAAPGQASLIARYARSRGHIDESWHVERRPYPAGVTANLLVRRRAFDSLGGFHEGIRSGGDVELCWRLQEAGWEFEHRPGARVEHLHPDSLGPLLRKTMRHAAGRFWVNRRYPGAYPRPTPIKSLVRSSGGAAKWLARGQAEAAVFKALDAAWHLADGAGYLLDDNRAVARAPSPERGGGPRILFMVDAAPARSETFVYGEWRALEEMGLGVRMEASSRAARAERAIARTRRIDYLEDDPPLEKLRSLAWLLLRHPVRACRDRLDRASWTTEDDPWPLAALAPAARRLARERDDHIHAHFAGSSALHALRLSRLIGVPFSIALHGYDVYKQPRNLAPKLRAATFAAAACDSMAADLKALLPATDQGRIHTIAMGVDPELFRRRGPRRAHSRRVSAVGRLVEKKGFRHLIDAVAILHREGAIDSVRIIGEGPLRDELTSQIVSLGLADVVTIESHWGGEPIRAVLEETDVMAVPCVIAADGDRDSMPVVAKEAMAMEVPVIASREVGLPELITDECGRLVPPGDPEALATAIEEVLSLPEGDFLRLGRRGRKIILAGFTIAAEAQQLAALIGPH